MPIKRNIKREREQRQTYVNEPRVLEKLAGTQNEKDQGKLCDPQNKVKGQQFPHHCGHLQKDQGFKVQINQVCQRGGI